MSCCVGDGRNQDQFIDDDIRELIGEAWQIDAPPSPFSLVPKKRVVNNSLAAPFHFEAETNSESRNFRFIVTGYTLQLRESSSRELQKQVHRPGRSHAICGTRRRRGRPGPHQFESVPTASQSPPPKLLRGSRPRAFRHSRSGAAPSGVAPWEASRALDPRWFHEEPS